MMSEIIFTPVDNIESAQKMRKIRNECREFMTKNTSYINETQQEKWFNELDKNNIKMFLMNESYDGMAFITIGFGYCWFIGTETYVTGGILENYRGKNYGEKLFRHLTETAKSFNSPITLEVLNTNIVAQNLYRKIGFKEIYKDDRILKMEYKI